MSRLFSFFCMSFFGLVLATGTASASWLSLPGYQAVTTSPLNFADGGWAGWSLTGKVVLGAEIISSGDSVSDFSVFKPVGPGTVTPFGYTYGANEYGFLFRDVVNGSGNNGVQIKLHFADMMDGYTITKSSALNFSGTGWGGWSAPSGNVVSGGGYEFSNTSASAARSEIALGNSVWPHYTFGADEEGWVVQNGGTASQGNVYVISFTQPIPEPATLTLFCLGAVGFATYRWRKLA